MAERILVVDDEADSRELLEALLRQEGFEVELAGDGKAALASALADPPDLVLLDLSMPGLTGIEVCQELRGNASTVDVPIIVVPCVRGRLGSGSPGVGPTPSGGDPHPGHRHAGDVRPGGPGVGPRRGPRPADHHAHRASTAQNAIAALKLGAFDFLVKGLDHNLIVLTVHRAVRHRRETLARDEELKRLRARLAAFEGEAAAVTQRTQGPRG